MILNTNISKRKYSNAFSWILLTLLFFNLALSKAQECSNSVTLRYITSEDFDFKESYPVNIGFEGHTRLYIKGQCFNKLLGKTIKVRLTGLKDGNLDDPNDIIENIINHSTTICRQDDFRCFYNQTNNDFQNESMLAYSPFFPKNRRMFAKNKYRVSIVEVNESTKNEIEYNCLNDYSYLCIVNLIKTPSCMIYRFPRYLVPGDELNYYLTRTGRSNLTEMKIELENNDYDRNNLKITTRSWNPNFGINTNLSKNQNASIVKDFLVETTKGEMCQFSAFNLFRLTNNIDFMSKTEKEKKFDEPFEFLLLIPILDYQTEVKFLIYMG